VSKTGLACDIEGGQKKKGTKVIGWSQHEGQNQKWKLSGNHIYSLLNNLVLDVKGGKTSSGSKVHMWPWHGGINQRWYITPLEQKMTNWFFIENSSGLVLDIAGGKQGGELQIYTKHGGDNQLWSRDEEGRLVSKTGLACDIEGGQKKKGTKVIGWSQHEGQNQKWKLSGNHIYSLLNNLVLDVKGGKTSSGSKVHMWPWHGGINQRWYITPITHLKL